MEAVKVKKANKKPWMRYRHKVITELARLVLTPVAKWKFGVKVERFQEQGDRAYLVLFNHQTSFDQFFVGMSFRGPIYYLATEDIFSLGWLSSLLRWAVAPIPIKKQTTDPKAVMNCIRVAREGGTIALAPEGNRTYHGRLVHINPAIAAMAKKMKLPIALYHIEGGYGVQPRWCDGTRKGTMRAYVSQVIEPEEYANWTAQELCDRICQGLAVDEAVVSGEYRSKKLAEYLERAMYVCPDCGLSVFESRRDIIACKRCTWKIRYLPTRELEGVEKPFPFRFVADWYDYQCDYVNQLNTLDMVQQPIYQDEARVSQVIVYKHKKLLHKNAKIALYGDRITVNDRVLSFADIYGIAVLGRNKLNIYHNEMIYQLKGDPRFNALKYVNIYYRSRNLTRGEEREQFLGL